MNLNKMFLIILLCFSANPLLYGLKRESYIWKYINCDGNHMEYCNLCPIHTKDMIVNLKKWEFKKYKNKMNILNRYKNLIPRIENKCDFFCIDKSIYKGYFDPYVDRYFFHFESYLQYIDNHKECTCYWPELSIEASKINDLAFDLFRDLILSTKLCHINKHGFLEYNGLMCRYDHPFWPSNENSRYFCCDYLGFQRFFENIPPLGLDIENDVIVCFVSHSFFYSDYYSICKDIYQYSLNSFDLEECSKIRDKLNHILQTLLPHFIALYDKCLKKHNCRQIEMEHSVTEFIQSI